MSACFYIVVEGEDPGYDIFVNGHALARHEAELERVAVSLQVRPMLDFFSADRNSMAILQEQGAGDPEWYRTLPAPQWFSPDAGLETVNALLAYVEADLHSFGMDTGMVLQELREYQRVLEKTAVRDLQWHLAVSWE
jgi:hypothetical protein